MQPKTLILSGYGINCEIETYHAFKKVGGNPEIIHLKTFLESSFEILNYNIIVFPGGFSFGDELGAGILLAAKLRKQLRKIDNFLKNGGLLTGICNGFQVLINLGLLPNTLNKQIHEVALIENKNKKFIDTWVKLKVNQKNNSPFFKGIENIYLPIRHKEGRLIIKDENIKNNIIQNNLNVLTYEDNPNGSMENIAALTDKSGQIIGMMPHPEAYLTIYNHPNWKKLISINPDLKNGEGLVFFENTVKYFK